MSEGRAKHEIGKSANLPTPVRIYCGGDYEHVMVRWPNGSIDFIESFWTALRVIWRVIRSGGRIEIIDRDEKP